MADLTKLDNVAIKSTPEEISLRKQRKTNVAQRKYNVHVALRLLQYIDDTPDMNQTKLAKMLGMSSAYLSRIINGKENLSLNTIAEYETRLGGYSLLGKYAPKATYSVIQVKDCKFDIFAPSQAFSFNLKSSNLFKKDSTYVRDEANIVYAW